MDAAEFAPVLLTAATTALTFMVGGVAAGAALLGARHGIRVGIEALKRVGRG